MKYKKIGGTIIYLVENRVVPRSYLYLFVKQDL